MENLNTNRNKIKLSNDEKEKIIKNILGDYSFSENEEKLKKVGYYKKFYKRFLVITTDLALNISSLDIFNFIKRYLEKIKEEKVFNKKERLFLNYEKSLYFYNSIDSKIYRKLFFDNIGNIIEVEQKIFGKITKKEVLFNEFIENYIKL